MVHIKLPLLHLENPAFLNEIGFDLIINDSLVECCKKPCCAWILLISLACRMTSSVPFSLDVIYQWCLNGWYVQYFVKQEKGIHPIAFVAVQGYWSWIYHELCWNHVFAQRFFAREAFWLSFHFHQTWNNNTAGYTLNYSVPACISADLKCSCYGTSRRITSPSVT